MSRNPVAGLPQCCATPPRPNSGCGVSALTGDDVAGDPRTRRENDRTTAYGCLIIWMADPDTGPQSDLLLGDDGPLDPCPFRCNDRPSAHHGPRDNRPWSQRDISMCLEAPTDPRSSTQVQLAGNH